GLLIGTGFGVLYALSGLPLAHLIDRTHRVRIVAIGVILWSICTVASGFAGSALELLVFRSGVAIGEAVLTPAAVSIIGDLFPREKRTLPTAVYTSAGTFMVAGAFVAGGFALDIAEMLSPQFEMESWRLALVLVGAPGLLIAPILLLTVAEPKRTQEKASTPDEGSLAQALAYVKSEGRMLGFVFLGMCSAGIVTFGYTAWTPTFLVRAFGWSTADAGYAFGMVGLVCGIAGAALWPFLVKAWTAAGRKDAAVLILALGVLCAEISVAVLGQAPSAFIVLAMTATMVLPGSTTAMLPPLIIQNVAPARVRARLMAMNLLASTLVGLAIGPPLCAWIAETFYEGPRALGNAMTTLALIFGPIAAGAMFIARPAYPRALDNALAREAA
ncbi:MAG: MFS transporter, partial [Hyphomonadaceae bacterium]